MKVSKAVSAVVFAAAAIAGSAGAFASQPPGQASTDLFIAVWNPTSNTSYVQDLGVTPYNPATNNSNPYVNLSVSNPSGWTIDGGNLATTLGSPGTGAYQYQIFAADNVTSPNTYAGNTMYLSLVAGSAIPVIQNGDLIGSGMTAVSSYIANYLKGSTTSYTSTGGSSSPDYWGNSLGPGNADSFTIANLNGAGGTSIGNALNLILYTGSPSDQPSDNTLSAAVGSSSTRGQFLLSGSSLSYTVAASTVPLPAAGWLLISGLLGLVAVSRRRGAEAI